MSDRQWLCSNCKSILGYIDSNGNVLRVKYKDLYLTASGGTVGLVCRKCARTNEVKDVNYEAYLKLVLKKGQNFIDELLKAEKIDVVKV